MTKSFKTLDDIGDVARQARAGPRGPERADGRRRGDRRHAAARDACRPSPNWPTRARSCWCSRISAGPRAAEPELSLALVAQAVSARCSAARCASSTGTGAADGGRDAAAGRHRGAGEHALLRRRGEERSRAWSRASRRSATSTSTTPSPPRTARMPRPRGWRTRCPPSPGARWRPNSTRWKRRWASPSIRSRRWSAAPRCRPSSTCCKHLVDKVDHLIIGGGMANTFLAARGVDVGKIAVRARSDRHRRGDPRRRRRARAAPSICPTTSWSRRSSARTRRRARSTSTRSRRTR